jgi:hypothetical protein
MNVENEEYSMKRNGLTTPGVAAVIAVLILLPVVAFAQPGTPANSIVGFPGCGVVQVGDLWTSFQPQAFGISRQDQGTYATEGGRQLLTLGNFDRTWSMPQHHWPNAFYFNTTWYEYIHAMVYDPDTNFNPTKRGVAATATGNWGQVTWKSTMLRASDPSRLYSIEPYFVDGTRRQHLIYEAGWPTNIGCDVKVRAHGFSGPNWGNFNDFVIIEIEFKNTGERDMNLDGTADPALADPAIKAMSLMASMQISQSISQYLGGGRNANYFTGEFYTRMNGWINDPDPEGNPWAFIASYPGANTQNPGAGKFNMGMNAVNQKTYTDIWVGWDWLDVKAGGLPTDRTQSTSTLASTNTIFGTHPVGVGPQRGWYVSANSEVPGASTISDPKSMWTLASGAFMKNGGSSRSFAQFDQSPNPNFFQSGTTGSFLDWVPKANPSVPNGDQKTLNTFAAKTFENGTGYPAGWGKWSLGYNSAQNYSTDMHSGVGPFRIGKDSSVTFVIAYVAGYRLEGIQRAVRAARYAYANNFNIPVLPPVPEMKVSTTPARSIQIQWDSRAESDPGFGGYKIWKTSNVFRKKWLDEGIRIVDRYQEQMTPGEDKTPFKKPVNPLFDAFGEVNATSIKGEYQPDAWGTWELLKTIPKAQLATVAGAVSPGYAYMFEDKSTILGFNYWYYVAAYKEGTFTGPSGETTSRIETHSINRNGASGLWQKTWPFAYNNPNFPKTEDGQKAIGNRLTVTSALAAANDLNTVSVRPNPYKRAALHDRFSDVYDHKLLFYNLPPECKITILDVSGQIIDEIRFSSTSAGSTFWDMFSKDGIEVASGLYIYVVESPSGSKKIGYFSILR